MKKAAVVGAGLAGLATALNLLDSYEVTLFDFVGIGGGASGVATGLLYPFPGKWALPIWRQDEGMQETKRLLSIAEEALNQKVCLATGVLRLSPLNYQKKVFFKRHKEHPNETVWWTEEETKEKLPNFAKAPGLWIPSGVTIFTKLYLQGLWLACEKKGAILKQEKIENLSSLNSFDLIILATGADSSRFHSFPHLEPVKGQTILCKWQEAQLPFSIASLGHMSPTEDPSFCQIGSTYEHGFKDLEPTVDAQLELLEKASRFYPAAKSLEVKEIRAGVRFCPKKGYRPTCEQISSKTWAITGFGSKGFIYHGLIAKELARELI